MEIKDLKVTDSAQVLKLLKNLPQEDGLTLKFPNETQSISQLQLADYKIKSCENLFRTMMSLDNASPLNTPKVDDFVKYYTGVILAKERAFQEVLRQLLGTDVYQFVMKNGFICRLSYSTNQITIFRREVNSPNEA